MGISFIQDLAIVLLVAGIVAVLSRRLKLSIVVGFLLAGVVIGPYTPPFQLVTDISRVHMLAELGLVFLIFAIGLDLNLKRIQSLGASVAIAVFVGSILMLNVGRILGLSLGWTGTQSLFLSSMLMVSSSAIISKVLEERGLTHERWAQLALGMTVLEDVVAITMLTLLTSIVQFGAAGAGQVLPTIGSFAAFVVFLFLVTLLVVPRLLGLLERIATAEMRNIVVVGLLLILAWLAVQVGYSAALSAFVLGAIVGGTRYKRSIERALEGMRQVFGALFFVAMGMLLDLRLLWDSLPLIAVVSACAIIGRVAATSIGLLSAGHALRDALRAGLNLTPIGEFSFIIAQLGVSTGVVPKELYPVAIGVSLVTAVLGPILTRYTDELAGALERRSPTFFRRLVDLYHRKLSEGFGAPSGRETLREAMRPLLPALLYIALGSALLLFIGPLYRLAARTFGEDWLFPRGLEVILGVLLGVVLLPPLISAWRHLSRFAVIVTGGVSPLVEVVIRTVITIVLVAWFIALLPFGFSVIWSLIAVVAVLLVIGVLAWSRLNQLHGFFEEELAKQIQDAQTPAGASKLARALRERPTEWDLRLEEIALPELTPLAGRSIADLGIRRRFGTSIVGIERRGFSILNPSRDEVLYSGDRILLLGTAQQLEETEAFLRATGDREHALGFEELTMESHSVPERSAAAGRTLLDLDLIGRFCVQVGGLEREGERLPTPTGATRVEAGDQILLIGTPKAIHELVAWMNTRAPAV